MKDQRRRKSWDGPKHADHDRLLEKHNRVGEVWEDDDGWVYFIVSDPTISVFEYEGRPFQFKHTTFVVSPDGPKELPLYETRERPFELSEILKRIA